MAELIPMQYRMRVAQKQRVSLWLLAGMATVGLSVASLTYAFVLGCQQSRVHDDLKAQYQEKASLIVKSQDLRAKRQDLANKMQQVQQMMDDKMLLTLLKNISEGFGSLDTLEYVSIDARSKGKGKGSPYTVHVTGITANSTTLAELMTRLGRHSSLTMNVVLESSKRETLMDGQVMRFQIMCEQLAEAGS